MQLQFCAPGFVNVDEYVCKCISLSSFVFRLCPCPSSCPCPCLCPAPAPALALSLDTWRLRWLGGSVCCGVVVSLCCVLCWVCLSVLSVSSLVSCASLWFSCFVVHFPCVMCAFPPCCSSRSFAICNVVLFPSCVGVFRVDVSLLCLGTFGCWCPLVFFTCMRVIADTYVRVCVCSCVSVFTVLNLPVVVCRRRCVSSCMYLRVYMQIYVYVWSVSVCMCICISMSISMDKALSWFCGRVVPARS